MNPEQIILPKGWSEKHVSDIIEILYGKGLPKEQRNSSGKYPVYGSNGIVGYHDEYLVDYSSIVIGRKGSAGALNFADSNFWATDVTYFVKRKNPKTPLKLIYYLLEYLKLSRLTQTGPKPGLNRNDVYKLKFFFPPEKIQAKIVQKLDYIFEQLEKKRNQFFTLKGITETRNRGRPKKGINQTDPLFKDLIYSSKQSIIDFAINGKITSDWRKKHPDAESGMELLNKIQLERKTKFDKLQKSKKNKKRQKRKEYEITVLGKHPLIPSWANAKLENIVYIAGRIGWKGLTSREYTSEGPLFLSVHSLNYGEIVDYRDAKHISWKRYEESPEIKLQENDTILTKDGAGIGKIGFVKNLTPPVTVNSSLLVIRSMDVYDPKFLFYLLSGPAVQKIVQERIDTTSIPHLYQRDIKNFILPVPPLAEQYEIVNMIESKLNIVLKLQNQIETIDKLKNSTISNLNFLRSSILERAFSGKLLN